MDNTTENKELKEILNGQFIIAGEKTYVSYIALTEVINYIFQIKDHSLIKKQDVITVIESRIKVIGSMQIRYPMLDSVQAENELDLILEAIKSL